MVEQRLVYLRNIASNLSSSDTTLKILRSYYLMRCNELRKGHGLLPELFSANVRCPHCCLEWTKNTEVEILPLKLHKKQSQNFCSQKHRHNRQCFKESRGRCKKQVVQICSFCKKRSKPMSIKPQKDYIKLTKQKKENILILNNQQKEQRTETTKIPNIRRHKSNTKSKLKKNAVVNVYSNAFDVFSLKNEKNTLSSAIKKPPKPIKNNKNKKDKYAGLCQKAVLASAKLKQQKETETPKNKLNLFLRPSSV